MRFVLGVDEAGRGPLAGPVSVGIVMVSRATLPKLRELFPGVNDSKQLSEEERERIFALMRGYAAEGRRGFQFCVRMGSHVMIDRIGISLVIRSAVARGVRTLAPKSAGVRVLLDGSLHAPAEYEQETIIGGDASEPIISLASIAAKVTRDRLMKRLAGKYPEYHFEKHKGYGTKLHYEMLTKYGPSPIHRSSYIPLNIG